MAKDSGLVVARSGPLVGLPLVVLALICALH